jgi:leader peptidase (prepilin peptidase) / N-methyltransferase
MTVVTVLGCGVLGLVVGWLLHPVIVRVPQPASGPVDLVPPAPITVATTGLTGRRIVVAIVCGALFGATGARFTGSWALPAYLVLTAGLVILAAIDLETLLLPRRIVYVLAAATAVLLAGASVLEDDLGALVRAAVAGVAVFAVFYVLNLLTPSAMGYGDVRLSFTLGLALGWLGWGEVVIGVVLAFVYAAFVGVILLALRRRGRKDPIPFGPFLVAGTLTAVLVGEAIVTWYTGG